MAKEACHIWLACAMVLAGILWKGVTGLNSVFHLRRCCGRNAGVHKFWTWSLWGHRREEEYNKKQTKYCDSWNAVTHHQRWFNAIIWNPVSGLTPGEEVRAVKHQLMVICIIIIDELFSSTQKSTHRSALILPLVFFLLLQRGSMHYLFRSKSSILVESMCTWPCVRIAWLLAQYEPSTLKHRNVLVLLWCLPVYCKDQEPDMVIGNSTISQKQNLSEGLVNIFGRIKP